MSTAVKPVVSSTDTGPTHVDLALVLRRERPEPPAPRRPWSSGGNSTDTVTPQEHIRYELYLNGVFDGATIYPYPRQFNMYLTEGIVNTIEVFAVDEAGNRSTRDDEDRDGSSLEHARRRDWSRRSFVTAASTFRSERSDRTPVR